MRQMIGPAVDRLGSAPKLYRRRSNLRVVVAYTEVFGRVVRAKRERFTLHLCRAIAARSPKSAEMLGISIIVPTKDSFADKDSSKTLRPRAWGRLLLRWCSPTAVGCKFDILRFPLA